MNKALERSPVYAGLSQHRLRKFLVWENLKKFAWCAFEFIVD